MKKMKKMFKVIGAHLTCCATVAICVTLSSCGQQQGKPVSNDYPTMRVVPKDIVLYEKYTASIQGKQNVEIRPQVSGQIVEVCINEGATIRKGQTLFIIDQVPYKAALKTAEANVNSAEATLATAKLTAESKKELHKNKVISDYDLLVAQNSLLEAQAGYEQAKAAEVNARNNLSYTMIKSPVDGVAGMIPYKVGALVNSSISTPLTIVSNSDEMYAYFSMTEKQAQDMIQTYGSLYELMKSMPRVKLQQSNGCEFAYTGKIDAISGTVDTETGAVGVRATFPNPEKLLMNGGTATIIIPHERKKSIVIPQSATFEVQNRRFAYKVVDNKAQSVAIETMEINNGKDFVVEKGLQQGDIIISEGAGLVKEGTAVNIKK